VLLIIQGIAELLRCWIAMRKGYWLERIEDVRETEDMADSLQADTPAK